MVKYALLPLVAVSLVQAASPEWHHGRLPSFGVDELVHTGCTAWINVVDVAGGLTCEAFLTTVNISKEHFISLNPQLNSECSNLRSNRSYCVYVPDKRRAWHTISVGLHDKRNVATGIPEPPSTPPFMPPQGTEGKAAAHPTTLTKRLRPTGAGCSKRSAPAPAGTGSSSSSVAIQGCKQHHTVKAGDTCVEIVKQYPGLVLGQFFKMNPSLDTDCQELQVDERVCVDGSPTARYPVPSATAALAARGAQGWPSPTKPGTNPGCKKFEMVKKGDSCEGVSGKHHISVAQLKQWNPAVGPTCEKLEIGYYACVGV
ncbi:hypothetical protein MaudCBS49596_007242 [Microsporum audouinii]